MHRPGPGLADGSKGSLVDPLDRLLEPRGRGIRCEPTQEKAQRGRLFCAARATGTLRQMLFKPGADPGCQLLPIVRFQVKDGLGVPHHPLLSPRQEERSELSLEAWITPLEQRSDPPPRLG